MNPAPTALCLGCMSPRAPGDACPNCGWRHGTGSESPLQITPGTTLQGRYLLGRVLGQGGFGITYLAHDTDLNRRVAVKEYFPQAVVTRSADRISVTPCSQNVRETFEYGLARFLEEGRALARFQDHPGIVQVLDYFSANGTAYMVMHYLDGITLKGYLEQKGGRLPFEVALRIAIPVMDSLRALHAAGMLHRDISPDNLFLTREGHVRLLDFGATRNALGEHSKSLSVILKPGYAPEEQYRSKGSQGPWTDIYALGATLYRTLTGVVPLDAPDRLHRDEVKKPSELGVAIPAPAEAALMKAMAVRAVERFRTVDELQAALAPPATPHPQPLPGPAKTSSRVPWIAGLALLFLIAAVSNAVWFAAYQAKERSLREANGDLSTYRSRWQVREELARTYPVTTTRIQIEPKARLFTFLGPSIDFTLSGPNNSYDIQDIEGKLIIQVYRPTKNRLDFSQPFKISRSDKEWHVSGSVTLTDNDPGRTIFDFWLNDVRIGQRTVVLQP